MYARWERRRRGEQGPWEQELTDFLRGFSGAFLFGMPLLFTMEMWWLGTYIETWRQLALLAIAFLASLGLGYFSGFKRELGFRNAGAQAVDAVAIGAVASVIVLLVLNRISPTEPLHSILGMIAVQTLPLSIGASVANAVFAPDKGREGEAGERAVGAWHATLNDVGATAAGATLLAFTVAPTEEIPMLASSLTYPHALALIAMSLVLTYVIVFESGFDPQRYRPGEGGIFQHPLPETVLAYVVALVIALGALLFYNPPQGDGPLLQLASQTLVLGLPAALGGAAGRLVI